MRLGQAAGEHMSVSRRVRLTTCFKRDYARGCAKKLQLAVTTASYNMRRAADPASRTPSCHCFFKPLTQQ
jgi:hypothetical protein